MPATTAEQDPRALVKDLANLIKEHMPKGQVRHDMINMLTSIGSSLYLMEGRISELEDILQEWTYANLAQ